MLSSEPRVSFENNRLTFCRNGGYAQISAWPEMKSCMWRADGVTPIDGLPVLPRGRLRRSCPRKTAGPVGLLVGRIPPGRSFSAIAVAQLARRRWLEAWACWDFASTIPNSIRQALAPFHHGQVGLLQVLAGSESKAFAELLATNPALAMGLAYAHRFVPGLKANNRLPWVAMMIPRRRREIATALGFPFDAVRTLGRIQSEHCRLRLLTTFRMAFRRDPKAVRALSHLPQIPGQILTLLTIAPDLWTPSLLTNILQTKGGMSEIVLRGMRELQRYRKMGLLQEVGHNSRILSREMLFDCQDLCQRQLEVHDWWRNADAIAAVAPPLPGTATIRPLSQIDEFLRERHEMKHCLLSKCYLKRLLTGESYFYRTVPPLERATIAIGRTNYPGEPLAFELVEACGPPQQRALREETLFAIRQWIAPYRRTRLRVYVPDLFALLNAAQTPLESTPTLDGDDLRRPLPKPPVPGTPNINPLTFPHEFLAEAAETEARTHLLLPLVGDFYVYRVLENNGVDRATMVVEPCRTEYWTTGVSMVALWGRRGGPVSEKTRDKVAAWIRDSETEMTWDEYDEPYEESDDDDPF